MGLPDTYVRARIDAVTKRRAAEALDALGLSIPDAIRLFMTRVAADRALPFEAKSPNDATRAAIAELEAGGGTHHQSVDDLMRDLES